MRTIVAAAVTTSTIKATPASRSSATLVRLTGLARSISSVPSASAPATDQAAAPIPSTMSSSGNTFAYSWEFR